MKALHAAALRRAYRTLAQGLGGSTVVTALVAVVAALSDADAARTALLAAAIAVGTTIVTALGSFWQGVAQGLPEVPLDPAYVPPVTEWPVDDRLADIEREADEQAALHDPTPGVYVALTDAETDAAREARAWLSHAHPGHPLLGVIDRML